MMDNVTHATEAGKTMGETKMKGILKIVAMFDRRAAEPEGLGKAWAKKLRNLRSPVTAARRRATNRKLARLYYGLRSKKHARRFVEVSL